VFPDSGKEADLAQRQTAAQPDDVLEEIGDWIGRRNAQAGEFARKAEAAGRQLWNDATRTGQSILGRTQSELRTLGAARPDHTGPESTPSPATGGSAGNSWLDRSGTAKFFGGQMAEQVGQGAGVARGTWHSVEGLAQTLDFVDRLLDPDDAEVNGADNAAWGRVFATGKSAANYIHRGIADPASVGRDVGITVKKLYTDTVPSATPTAPAFAGEMARRLGIGLNQGELGWDVGSLALGSPALKTVEGLGALGDATSAAEYVEKGFSAAQADRLAKPYSGVGHHSPLSQTLANKLGVPDWLRDSPFNVVKPDGMNQGDFYGFHFRTDPQFYGAGFSRKIGGGGWSGKKLGLQKYGVLGRFWYGTPTPLAGVSAAAGAAGLSNYGPMQDPTQ
jgi:hypothetical protein